MTGSEMDKLILALEQVNSERIRILNSKCVSDGLRLQRMKTEIRHLKLDAVFNHLAVRCFRKKIPVTAAERNLEYAQERALARHGNPKLRVAVYTCITGKYDVPRAPFYAFDHCDYFLFSEQSADGWIKQKIPEKLSKIKNQAWMNRYIKFHPFEFFAGDYDYSIYIDGNITPVSDLSVLAELVVPKAGLAFHRHCSRSRLEEEFIACKNMKKGNPYYLRRQIDAYQAEGMPDDYGLVEGNVIVTDLRNQTAKKLMDACWREFIKKKGGRDQIVWPYVFWKAGICISEVCTLGNNVWLNPKFYITNHADAVVGP